MDGRIDEHSGKWWIDAPSLFKLCNLPIRGGGGGGFSIYPIVADLNLFDDPVLESKLSVFITLGVITGQSRLSTGDIYKKYNWV